jgi:hypothetical protein
MSLTSILVVIIVILGYCLYRAGLKIYKCAKWFEKIKNSLEAQKGQIDLELATREQILDEMAKRPNNRFLLLTPHQRSGDLHIEIHSANIPIPLALNMLKATYEGVIDVVRRSGGKIEEGEIEEE